VVDEFTELLHASPDILELLLKVGRVGRALGVHMLLASQRLEEGRMRGLERHLSYRIGMRTFSAAESRLALGVPDAYELPSSPGHAYLKVGSEPLIRFRAAYTSEPWPPQRPDPDFFSSSTVFETVVNRLHGRAYPAHQMWLPNQR
jgi:DNA segregation ATPase FtsK/SpoIIIE, S-DNA-T family